MSSEPRLPAQPAPAAGASPNGLPSAYTAAVLRMIWEERTLSRADIARRAGLSRSTVSEIVTYLLGTGLVVEAGIGASRGGRRPIVLQFQDRACGILGIDMGAAHVTVVLTDLRGRVLASEGQPFDVRHDPDGTRALIDALAQRCVEREDAPARLLGIGISVPSPVDPRNPERLSEAVLPDWQGRNGFDALRARLQVPLFVDNDANLGALAEQWWGAGRGYSDFTYVKVATGVGSGHVIDGEVRRGATGVAGEIGHVAIDPRGAPCRCGNRGCLVTFVGTAALVARALELLPEYPDTTLTGSASITIEAIEAAAIADDPLAVQVVREAAEHLGIAIAGLLNLMNPGAVIIGGGLTRVGHRLLAPLREVVMRRTFVSAVAATEIRHSELGPLGVARGAATLVLDAALRDPRLFPSIGAAAPQNAMAS